MRRPLAALILTLSAACVRADGPIPDEVKGQPGTFVVVPAKLPEGVSVAWYAPDAGLSVMPSSLLRDSRSAVCLAGEPGRYRLVAHHVEDGTIRGPHVCVIVVGDPGPRPDPGPGPRPEPGPGPAPEPEPDPAPIPEPGLRVLIVYESGEATKLPLKQQAILFGKEARDFLNSACVVGPDGRTREFRIYDQHVDTAGESSVWRAAMERPRQSIPWLVVSNGTAGYEGPLPADPQSFIELVKRYAK